ncbi:MAG: endonuclease V [Bacteroidota bacterium]
MKIAIDVHYRADFAKVVSIEFEDWSSPLPSAIHEVIVTEVEAYESGAFYKRELPCILQILKKTPIENIELIIVDGYVVLNDEGKAGLGMYLYQALEKRVPVIGVAKKAFLSNTQMVREIYRGQSQNPLMVTSVGIDLEEAAQQVQLMYGPYRLPDLLRILDQTTKA